MEQEAEIDAHFAAQQRAVDQVGAFVVTVLTCAAYATACMSQHRFELQCASGGILAVYGHPRQLRRTHNGSQQTQSPLRCSSAT